MHTPSLAVALAGLFVALAVPDVPDPRAGSAAAPGGTPAADLQEAGAALAAELGCAACHAGAPDAAEARRRAPRLGAAGPALTADFVFTYLADPVRRRDDIGASRMPDFRLDEGERVALALFLGTAPDQGAVGSARTRHPDATAERGRGIWAALGCSGCHGSPSADGGPGQAAEAPRRLGPDLSREGERVRSEWLRRYLADPGPIRGPAHPTAPGSRMPDFRLTDAEADALTAWIGGPGAPAREAPPPLTAHQTERTTRYLDDRAGCLGCHRLGGRGGGIGPSLDGAADRLRPGFVVHVIQAPDQAVPGAPMPRQPMPDREARRLARLVLDTGDGPWRPAAHPSLADPDHPAWSVLEATAAAGGAEPDGGALYARHCAACHGTTGRADGWNAPNLPVPPTAHADPALMAERTDDRLYDGIHAGAWVLDGSPRMPPFGTMLGDAQIRALVRHLRTLCACEQPAWAGDGR